MRSEGFVTNFLKPVSEQSHQKIYQGWRRRAVGGEGVGGREGEWEVPSEGRTSTTVSPTPPYYSVRKSENPMRTYRHFFFVLRAKPKFPKISSFWGNKSPFLLARSNAPFPRQDVLGFGLLRFAPSASPAPVWSFLNLTTQGRRGRWISTSVGTQMQYCFHHG